MHSSRTPRATASCCRRTTWCAGTRRSCADSLGRTSASIPSISPGRSGSPLSVGCSINPQSGGLWHVEVRVCSLRATEGAEEGHGFVTGLARRLLDRTRRTRRDKCSAERRAVASGARASRGASVRYAAGLPSRPCLLEPRLDVARHEAQGALGATKAYRGDSTVCRCRIEPRAADPQHRGDLGRLQQTLSGGWRHDARGAVEKEGS